MLKKLVIAWDLDGTLVEPNPERIRIVDGKVDIAFWDKHATEEYIMGDTLLPVSELFFMYQNAGFTQICVTARILSDADFKFFKKHNMKFDFYLHREDSHELDQVLKNQRLKDFFEEYGLIPYEYWDDKQENLEVAEKFGFRTFHAKYMNKKLAIENYKELNFKPKHFI